jgi:FkbM family methyltransferase
VAGTPCVVLSAPQSVIEDDTAPAPDLIKIDVERAEYDILTAFDPHALTRVRWIVGELHGERFVCAA